MSTLQSAAVRELSRTDIQAVLERNQVGRLAYARGGRIDVVPIAYVYSGDTLYGRTAPGGKAEAFDAEWTPVTFEVDEVSSLFRWRSVLVYGGVEVLTPEHPAGEWMRALGLLRRVIPATLRSGDPVPERSVLFRIVVQEMAGRAMG